MYLTRAEVAERLRVHPRTVDRYIRSGALKAIKNPGRGGQVRISEEDLADYIKRQAFEPTAAAS